MDLRKSTLDARNNRNCIAAQDDNPKLGFVLRIGIAGQAARLPAPGGVCV
jgi:hypothetical protein